MRESFDVVVVGAGPGGYVAAIRAAQRGLSTALVERQDLGGVCLNRGCIPSKAMLRSAELLRLSLEAEAFGVPPSTAGPGDYGAMVRRRDAVVEQLSRGVTNLLTSNHVVVMRGEGRIRDAQHVEVVGDQGTTVVEFRNLIVATGSRSAGLPIPGADLPGVIDSDGALTLTQVPRRAVIIGGGAIGVEWADIWRAFGSEVTVLELLPQIIPTEETEIARQLERAFTQRGMVVKTGAQVREIRAVGDALEVAASVGDQDVVVPADVVLCAVGRRPNLEGLNLEAAGVAVERRGLATDAQMRTNVPQIYAVGDVLGRWLLAHVASHQGIIAAETIAGETRFEFDPRIIPAAIFTHPEVASVGLREREATEQGIATRIGRFPFVASGRAQASGETDGFVKLIAAAESGAILGAHIIGPSAGDLIGEVALAMRLNATLEDLAHTIHVHPTFSEALAEAAWVALGTPIHVPPRPARRTA